MFGNSWIMGMTLTLCSLFFYVFLMIVYFRKNAKYNLRNYLYRRILYFGLAGFAFSIVYLLLCGFTQDTIIIAMAKKFELLALIVCLFLWIYYVVLVIFAKDKQKSSWIRTNRASIDLYLLLAFATIAFITLVLPVRFHMNANEYVDYVYGPAFVFAEMIIGILCIVPVPFIMKNQKIIVHKRLFAYYFQLLVTVIIMLVHWKWPSVSMIAFSVTLCCYMIYNRLENPDNLLVRKYKRSSDLLSEIREHYGFIFGMSPELRELLNEVASMQEDYKMKPDKGINRKKLDSLLTHFIEGKVPKKGHFDDDGVEILDFEEDPTEDMMVTKEIYSLNDLQEVLKEDNLPKW